MKSITGPEIVPIISFCLLINSLFLNLVHASKLNYLDLLTKTES